MAPQRLRGARPRGFSKTVRHLARALICADDGEAIEHRSIEWQQVAAYTLLCRDRGAVGMFTFA